MKFFLNVTLKSLLLLIILVFVCPGNSHQGYISINGNQYVLGQFLGSGRDGDIYLTKKVLSIFDKSTKVQSETFAVKIYRNSNFNLGSKISEKNFIQVASNKLKSKDFLLVYDYGVIVFSNDKTFSEPKFALVMEYVEGQPLDQLMGALRIQPDLPLSENLFRLNRIEKFINFSIRVTELLQKAELSHVDLGPKNIMLKTDGSFKLIDLDSIYGSGIKSNSFDMYFSPPEVVKNKPQPGISDFYSFAFIVFQMLIGDSPYRRLEKRLEELKSPEDAFTLRLETTPFKNQIEWRSPGSHHLLKKIMEEDIEYLEKRFKNYPEDFLNRMNRLINFVKQGSHYSVTEREKGYQEVRKKFLDLEGCEKLLYSE